MKQICDLPKPHFFNPKTTNSPRWRYYPPTSGNVKAICAQLPIIDKAIVMNGGSGDWLYMLHRIAKQVEIFESVQTLYRQQPAFGNVKRTLTSDPKSLRVGQQTLVIASIRPKLLSMEYMHYLWSLVAPGGYLVVPVDKECTREMVESVLMDYSIPYTARHDGQHWLMIKNQRPSPIEC